MLNVDNVAHEFRKALPELYRTFAVEVVDFDMRNEDGSPSWHIVFSQALEPVYRAFEEDRIIPEMDELVRRVFRFIERMLVSDDEDMGDVATASLVERLSDYWQIEGYYGDMPPELERWIRLWRDPNLN